jgi:6-phosphofructokinase 2
MEATLQEIERKGMNKIITITLNPAIDKTTSTEKVVPEKKLRCAHPTYEPGGGGINVSRALSYLGSSSLAMYFAGGYNGSFFRDLLSKENIPSLVVSIKGNTRTNLIVVDKSTQLQYRFGMVSPPVEDDDWQLFLQEFEKQSGYEYVVASGSLPEGVPLDFFGRVAAIVKKQHAKLIVDTSGEALRQAVQEGVFMIKPNLNELSSLYGKEELQEKELVTAARSIINSKGCEVMVVSMGKDGAVLVTAEQDIHIVPPAVTIKSTVGAGDSMVAGMVFGLSKGMNWKEILQYGIACGTAATMNEGTALCKKERVEELLKELQEEL